MENGKGDKPRPKDREKWEKNYERIFQKKHSRKPEKTKKEFGKV